jgi:hypothetical protein
MIEKMTGKWWSVMASYSYIHKRSEEVDIKIFVVHFFNTLGPTIVLTREISANLIILLLVVSHRNKNISVRKCVKGRDDGLEGGE